MWPDDQPGLPPLDGVLPALASFVDIGDATPLDIEIRVSTFLSELGAGDLGDPEPGEPGHEELLNGLVEICLHHLDHEPPRVLLDFCWVVDAFGLGYLQWPVRDRLGASELPSRPAWAWAVGAAAVTSTHLVTHDLADGYDVAISARHPGADKDHVVAVYVDDNLDGMAKDLLVHDDATAFLSMSADEPGMYVSEIDQATAAAMIDDAMDVAFATGEMAPVAEQFGAYFSIVEHYVAKLPGGGASPGPPAPAPPDAQADVISRFLVSDVGSVHSDQRAVLLDAVEFVVDELGGDPLRWSPVVVHLVAAGWLPLSSHGPDALDGFAEVVRDFVPWAHAEQGWGDRYVADALAVLDAVVDSARSGPMGAVGGVGSAGGVGRVEVLEQAVAAGIDLDDEAALDAFLDEYLDE